MQRKFIGGITEDWFLNEDNICTWFNNLSHEICNVFSFFLEDSIHGGVVLDDDGVLNLSLGRAKTELD